MKKVILSLLLFCLSSWVNAWEVTILNVGERDIEVTYHVCSDDNFPNLSNDCLEEKKVLIKSKNNDTDKNYFTVEYDKSIPYHSPKLEITSAIEKDEHGKIISKGKYIRENVPNYCSVRFQETEPDLNLFILLDDMKGSPFISCSIANAGSYIE